jgi:arylsulfatase A-like enzyme
MPTALDLLEAEIPPQCNGASLRPFLEGGRPDTWRESVFWEWDFRDPAATAALGIAGRASNLAVIRDREGKYVHFAAMPAAFYDLAVDPGELHNLIDDPAAAPRILDYAQRLLSWRQSTDDQTLAHLLVTPAGILDVG